MKTIAVAVLILTALSSTETSAQLVRNWGVKAALTSADQRMDYAFDSGLDLSRRAGFNVGAFVEWLNLPVFSVVSQVEYAQRGVGENFIVTGPSGPTPVGVMSFYSRLDYLSIPLLAKVRFQTPVVEPYLMAGPRLDILLGNEADPLIFNGLYDRFKKTSVGGSVGAGIQTSPLLAFSVLVEVRYNFDFADSYSTDFLKVRNNAFDVWLGVAL